MKTRILLPLLICLAAACGKGGDVAPANVFGDDMVLQRDVPNLIWGTAAPGTLIRLRWLGSRTSCKADSLGRWHATLPAAPAGGPHTLKINGLKLKNILLGDLYIGSGQSNMELPVRRCLDATGKFVESYSNKRIRYFSVPQNYDFDGPEEDVIAAKWQSLDGAESAMDWSAVLYFTARSLQDADPEVPIGIINSSVGGSPIESWMSEKILPDYALAEMAPFKDKAYLDSIVSFNSTLYSKWQRLHDSLPANTGAVWKKIDLFSTDWALDSEGRNVYGSHFLRNRLTLSAEQARGPAKLHLGTMADADSCFVNGRFVGNTTYFYPPRNYDVAAGILKEGENEIEIHLYATGGRPASFVRDKEYSLESASGKISLLEGWEHKDGKRLPARPSEVFLRWKPAVLWNAMMAPIAKLRTAGVIWYQGESNCDNAARYGDLLEMMIRDWRERMDNPDLPFYIVELAAYQHSELSDSDSGWNRVQKEQKRVCDIMDRVYFVKNGDLGEWNDIHPQDKKTLGERIARKIIE